MRLSNIPAKFPVAWASSAGPSYVRAIPTTSQIGIINGAASLPDGFPPLTFLNTDAGGFPPDGRDENGILNEITLWNQWQQAGAPLQYDSAFSAAIGGYPNGAILTSAAAGSLFWLSTVDNNTTDPDTGGGGWTQFALLTAGAAAINVGTLGGALTGTLPSPGLAAFNTSFSGDGYIVFPGGLVVQWGTGTLPANTATTFSFNVAFNNAALFVIAAQNYSATATAAYIGATVVNSTQFEASNGDPTFFHNFNWFAIGF